MVMVTNFRRFPKEWTSHSGRTGRSIEAHSAPAFLRHSDAETLWVVNCDPSLTLKLAAYLRVAPWTRARLVAVDLVLRHPRRAKDATLLPLKRFLLDRVDHFINYFSDLRDYQAVFGIDSKRSSFVPFKTNLHGMLGGEKPGEGEYILCFGRSMRDFDTFFDAVESLPHPAAICSINRALLEEHGARFTRRPDQLPKNVRVLDDDGSDESQIRILRGAKIVVLPVLKTSMVASGISSCLNAMSLGRCVVGSEGPGMSDVFQHGEAIIVPREDPAQLRAALENVWGDPQLLRRTAQAGHAYAQEAGGEKDLYQRIVDCVAEL